MQIHESIASLRAARSKAGRVALVPTMGNLHDGHIALMTQARAHADQVMATIFVNRLQFRPGEDFESYPRTFAADCQRLEAAGVEHLFAPLEAEMYPQPQTYVVEPPEIQHVLEGALRPGHYRGVATVVLKLFNMVQPQVAVFGKKDYQQCRVLDDMVRQLNLPVELLLAETVRADDGLALSSRNGYLTAIERAEAPQLNAVLRGVAAALQAGSRDFAALETAAHTTLSARGWRPDYVAIRRQRDLLPAATGDRALVVLAAARIGVTRLIDNLEVSL